VATGWRDHISAVGTDVEAGTEAAARIVADEAAGVGEVEVASPGAGLDDDALGKGLVFVEECRQSVLTTMVGIDVEDYETAHHPGPDGDVGGRPALPPSANGG
jgi:hypothetical protein